MTNTTNQPFAGTIAALQAAEVSNWQVSDSLLFEWNPPKDRTNLVADDYLPLEAAQRDAGLVPMSYHTARSYRQVAAFWPVADRVPGINYTAHRSAMRAGSGLTPAKALAAAKNCLTVVLNDVGGDGTQVTQAKVLAEVSRLTGRAIGTGKAKSGNGPVSTVSVASVTEVLEALRVKEHYKPIDAATLNRFATLLRTTADRVDRHVSTRAKATAQHVTASKTSAKTAAKPKASKAGVPTSARGN